MKSVLTSALALAALTGAAVAGDVQLARLAGVDAASYSNAELTQIIEARKDNDAVTLRFLLSGGNRATIGSDVTPGSEQLARLAGVEPGVYTPAELTLIQQAREEGDKEALNYFLSHANRSNVGDTVKVTRGRVHLAAIAGLDAGTSTLTEIAQSQPD